MSIYTIQCPACKKEHLWFSGNTGELRCPACQEKGKEIHKQIDAATQLYADAIQARAQIRALSVRDFIIHPIRTHRQVNAALDLEDIYWGAVRKIFGTPTTKEANEV